MALRFDFVPTSFTFSQWKSPPQIVAQQRRRFIQVHDQDIEIAIVIEIAKGASAAGVQLPRSPGPPASINSSNFPLPRLRNITRGVLIRIAWHFPSTSGYTLPVDQKQIRISIVIQVDDARAPTRVPGLYAQPRLNIVTSLEVALAIIAVERSLVSSVK